MKKYGKWIKDGAETIVLFICVFEDFYISCIAYRGPNEFFFFFFSKMLYLV